uniref:F-box protein PP2-B12 n=1 Tax=Zea mays TaxID=4577 RepID=A0A804P1P2_MAIZE
MPASPPRCRRRSAPRPTPTPCGHASSRLTSPRSSTRRLRQDPRRSSSFASLKPMPSLKMASWETGAKSYMIAARAMAIIWVDTPDYWRWIVREDSRMLSGDTRYAAYLVFKMADDCFGLDSPLQEASVSVGEGGTSTAHWIRLQSYHVGDEENGVTEEGAPPRLPHERPDGWMEVELGDWYNHGGDDDLVVRASVKEARFGGNWKKGLIVQGLEIRPKN